MMRHRAGDTKHQSSNDNNNESSDDEEDVFTALSRKRKGKNPIGGKKKNKSTDESKPKEAEETTNAQQQQQQKSSSILPVSQTSSTKRHHITASDSRKAKMDAILMELEEEKNSHHHRRSRRTGEERGGGGSYGRNSSSSSGHYFVPDKKGSFVEPGEEHLTTNIFIGNLAPTVTEEQVTELFRQFGDLYSIKIMWPRTIEERARNRNTGFVCFMNRNDAEDAMDACNETDPFNVGRRIMMRWGKNVKKTDGGVPIVKKGTGADTYSIRNNNKKQSLSDLEKEKAAAAAIEENLKNADENTAIRVIPPNDRNRFHFISTVASFVATDGSQFESALYQCESNNPTYDFLFYPTEDYYSTEIIIQEHIFYRWRVYAFCQGDTYNKWNMKPFQMIENGCTWIPPPIDVEAARKEEEEERIRQEQIQRQRTERQILQQQNSHYHHRTLATGRQLEQGRQRRGEGGMHLTIHEKNEFDQLFIQQLCCSRDSICQAMAYCFEKSGAAQQIASMIQDLFLHIIDGTSVDTLTARLFLISDVLFNSQQPGIKNAFMYRDAIEKMSPSIFKNLGSFSRASFGRMSRERLASAVNSVLAAWANWGVYDPVFLDVIQAHFEGKEIVQANEKDKPEQEKKEETEESKSPSNTIEENVVRTVPRGDWINLDELTDKNPSESDSPSHSHALDGNSPDDKGKVMDSPMKEDGKPHHAYVDGETLGENEMDADGEPLDDADGEAIDEDEIAFGADGKPLGNVVGESIDKDKKSDIDADGEPLDDVDGEELEEEEDGQPLDDADGEALDDNDKKDIEADRQAMVDADGQAFDKNDNKGFEADGEALQGIDGEAFDENDQNDFQADGEPLDDEDGEPLDEN